MTDVDGRGFDDRCFSGLGGWGLVHCNGTGKIVRIKKQLGGERGAGEWVFFMARGIE